ncbi:hypothetical protein, partial [Ancylobacter oerskovii]|uniref:hypothetical protein n=1 Tax=Ancylobacter oerskovii TaxID=459519 RepID=UPI001BD07AA7
MTLGLADADAVNRGLLGAKFIPVVADSLAWLSATQCRINFSMDSARQLVLDDGTGPVTATGIETSKGIFCRDGTDAYAADIPVTSVTVESSGFTASPNQSIYVTLGRAVNQGLSAGLRQLADRRDPQRQHEG